MPGNNEKVSPSEETTLTDELKKQIRSKFIGAVAAGVIAGAGSALALGITLFNKISGEVGLVPEGTVAAFDLKSGCPGGWKEYGPAYGRFILGANPDDRNNLSKREYRETKGEEQVTLLEDHIPRHNHNLNSALNGVGLPWGGGNHPVPVAANHPSAKLDIGFGKGKAHNNMPPYIALYYCIKK